MNDENKKPKKTFFNKGIILPDEKDREIADMLNPANQKYMNRDLYKNKLRLKKNQNNNL
jgi:hypothetical protein